MTMKRAFAIGLVIVGVAFLVGGAYTSVQGLHAQDEVRTTLVAQHITTPEDAEIPNAPVDDAATADAMANIIGVHAVEATGGQTYAQMDRYLAAGGNGTTSDETQALKDEAGNPVANPLRNVAFQAMALQTALHFSHLSFELSRLVIGLGALIVVLGFALIGIGLVFGAIRFPARAHAEVVEPAAVGPVV
jgi:hypothetical protein